MEWSLAIAPALLAVAIFLIPGLLVAVAAGQKGFEALGPAPAVSTALVALGAIIAPVLGVGWSLLVPLVLALVLAALIWGFTALARRLGFEDAPRRGQTALRSQRWWSRNQAWAYGALALAVILLGRNITNAIGDPTWVSQTYDVNFHLNAIRYIVDQGNASSFYLASMTAGDGPVEFYPAAWHGIASLLLQATGADVPVIANTMSLVVGAFVWPLSLIYMLRGLLRLTGPALLATGALASAYVAFPLLLVYFGVLYPNSLGVALMPAGLALLAQLFRASQVGRVATVPAVILGIFVALGAAFAHPSSVMSLLVIAVPLFIFIALRQLVAAVKRRVKPWLAALQVLGMAGLLWAVWILWGIVRPAREAGGWEPTLNTSGGVGEFIINDAVARGHLWLISLIALAGIYPLLRTRTVWLVGSWAYLGFFYVAIRAMTWDEGRDWVTGVWYHDPYRVAAMIPLVSIPLAAAALDALVRAILDRPQVKKLGRPALVLGLTAALLTGGLAYGTQTAKNMQSFIATSYWSYAPSQNSPLLTTDEYKLLYSLDDYVPADATIIANPWTGAGLAYAIADRKVTGYHTNYKTTDDIEVLNQELDQVLTNPQVCQVIDEYNARYAIFFGHQEINQWISGTHTDEYESLEYLANPDVINSGQVAQVVYQAGGATLYRITACG